MSSVMAPVLPYLAEEVHHYTQGGGDNILATPSVFEIQWAPLVRMSGSCKWDHG